MNVDADLDRLIRDTDFTAQDVNDIEDALRDFEARCKAVADTFEQQFGVSVDLPEAEVFAIGPDNINFVMFCRTMTSDMGVHMARFFDRVMGECGRRISSRTDTSKFNSYTQVDSNPNRAESTGTFTKEDKSLM